MNVFGKKNQQASWGIVWKQSKISIWKFDSVANWIFSEKSHWHKKKSQTRTFHEVLPGILVFFHFYYIRKKELEYLDQTIALYWKNYVSTENFKSGIENLSQLFRDQPVGTSTVLPNKLHFYADFSSLQCTLKWSY